MRSDRVFINSSADTYIPMLCRAGCLNRIVMSNGTTVFCLANRTNCSCGACCCSACMRSDRAYIDSSASTCHPVLSSVGRSNNVVVRRNSYVSTLITSSIASAVIAVSLNATLINSSTRTLDPVIYAILVLSIVNVLMSS